MKGDLPHMKRIPTIHMQAKSLLNMKRRITAHEEET
jgi:hypothetical protein